MGISAAELAKKQGVLKAAGKEYLADQLAFYSAYHQALGNVAIHVVFVPTILVVSMSLLMHVDILSKPLWGSGIPAIQSLSDLNFPVNNALFGIYLLMYPLTYLGIDLASGLSYLPWATLNWWMANWVYLNLDLPTIAVIKAVSWALQFFGHGYFEGRKPALLDSLYQSIVLAPFFVWFELALFPLGYGSSFDLQGIVHAKAAAIQKQLDSKA